jgi:UDP-N-acetyl-D-glucosamine dehydrogenase
VAELPGLGYANTPLKEALSGADLVVIVTAHPGVDHGAVIAEAPLLVDLRGITRGADIPTVQRL